MKRNPVFVKNSNMVTRQFDDETILMPVCRTSEDIDCIYTLNKDAVRIWGLINGRNTLSDIKKIILKEFDIEEEKLNKKMDDLIKDLRDINAINAK